jgi:acetoin utilization deacetylase AcuC-like enzyme
MRKTGLVLSDRFMEHDTGRFHPERPDRIRAIRDRFAERGLLESAVAIEFAPVESELIERVHAAQYNKRVREACERGARVLDTPDCPICPATYEIARLAAGGVIAAVDAVADERVASAFCAVRPPGHHAEHGLAMGFCFFNNIALAAEHLRVKHGIQRVAILDWDVHHGNGTQHHFEADADVLFVSIHQHPATLFPGTGYEWETGSGPGEGTTLNVPMAPHTGDDDYRERFESQIFPAIESFKPEWLLVSTGFDAHRDDPLANVNLSTEMFGWMTREARELAERCCQGRLVTVLEGGYDLPALADSAELHFRTLAD